MIPSHCGRPMMSANGGTKWFCRVCRGITGVIDADKPKVRERNNAHEHNEQVAVIDWAKYEIIKYPCLDLLYSIPNGGARNVVVAVKLKAEGVKSGVPDLCLPVARHGFHSLYIEMKYGKNKPSADQKRIIERLQEEGNKVVVCYSADEAIKALKEYLGSKLLERKYYYLK